MIESILEFLKLNYSHFLIEEEQRNSNIPHVFLKPEGIVPVLEALKTHEKFSLSYLNDLTAVDWLGKRKIRFEVLYLLRSPKNKHSQIQIRVPIDEGDSVP
jgi:NADH-quinone oxidoreductase subunit C